MIQVAITNEQTAVAVDEERLRAAVRAVLEDAGRTSAEISVAVVDDPTIHHLNRKYLDHDYATDVLSFLLDDDQDHLAGDVVVSGDTALAAAESFAWPASDELLLYVVHGTLHLLGYDDHEDAERERMHARQEEILEQYLEERA